MENLTVVLLGIHKFVHFLQALANTCKMISLSFLQNLYTSWALSWLQHLPEQLLDLCLSKLGSFAWDSSDLFIYLNNSFCSGVMPTFYILHSGLDYFWWEPNFFDKIRQGFLGFSFTSFPFPQCFVHIINVGSSF